MRALILVDLQNDFFPGGALAVKDSEQILPVINHLLQKHFDLIIASKDWHPADHCSFAETHGRAPGEHIDVLGLDQILWPIHCVQGTPGSDFTPGWDSSKVQKVIYKGTDKNVDSYSTFYDNGHRKTTGLENYLRERGIKELYLAGLITEYCVKYSALDAREMGFEVYVVEDGCKPGNLKKEDGELALQAIRASGAHLIHSSDV